MFGFLSAACAEAVYEATFVDLLVSGRAEVLDRERAAAQQWIEQTAAGQAWAAQRGISLPLELRAVRFNCYQHPMLKREVCGGDFEAELRRSDFGINTARYRSARYDALLDAAGAATDSAARRAQLEAAERLLLAEHPILPLYFYVTKHLVNPRVVGWYDNAMNVTYSAQLALQPVP